MPDFFALGKTVFFAVTIAGNSSACLQARIIAEQLQQPEVVGERSAQVGEDYTRQLVHSGRFPCVYRHARKLFLFIPKDGRGGLRSKCAMLTAPALDRELTDTQPERFRVTLRNWTEENGINISQPVPLLHPDSWAEAPVVIQAELVPHNLVQVGAFSGIYGGRLGHCSIGRYCSIAPGVDIASDQHPTNWFSTSMVQYVQDLHGWGQWLGAHDRKYCPPQRGFNSNSPVKIENDVWIGQGVFIKSGVTIGNGAIIAARSVVTRDVDAYTIVAGAPARPIKARFEQTLVERILATQWWKYNIMSLPGMDFVNPSQCVEMIQQAIERGTLEPLSDERFALTAT